MLGLLRASWPLNGAQRSSGTLQCRPRDVHQRGEPGGQEIDACEKWHKGPRLRLVETGDFPFWREHTGSTPSFDLALERNDAAAVEGNLGLFASWPVLLVVSVACDACYQIFGSRVI